MIGALIYSHLRFWKKYKQAPWKIFLDLMYTLMAVGNGAIVGFVIKMQGQNALQSLNADDLLMGVYLLAFAISAIRLFFPVYRQWKDPFPGYYPLSFMKRASINNILDLIQPYFLFAALFFLSIMLTDPGAGSLILVNGLLMILTGHFGGRLIQLWIANRYRPAGSVYIGSGLILLTAWIVIYSGKLLPAASGLIIFLALILAQIQALKNKIESRNRKQVGGQTEGFLFLKLLWKNPYTRAPLLISLGIKIFALTADIISYSRNGEHLFGNDSALTLWFIGNPLVWYSYMFNNSWGYWSKIWLINDLGSGRFGDMLRQHLRLLALPVAIDMVITLPVLLSYWEDSMLILVYYFTASFFLLTFSVFWSTYKPVRVTKTLQRVSSSQTGSMVSIAAMMFLTMISLNIWFYLVAGFCVIMSIIISLTAKSYYPDSRYRIFRVVK